MAEEIKQNFVKVDLSKSSEGELPKNPESLEMFMEKVEYLVRTCEDGRLPVDEKNEPVDLIHYLNSLLKEAVDLEYEKRLESPIYSDPLRRLHKHLLSLAVTTRRTLKRIVESQNPLESLKTSEREMFDLILGTAIGSFKLGMDYGRSVKEENRSVKMEKL